MLLVLLKIIISNSHNTYNKENDKKLRVEKGEIRWNKMQRKN